DCLVGPLDIQPQVQGRSSRPPPVDSIRLLTVADRRRKWLRLPELSRHLGSQIMNPPSKGAKAMQRESNNDSTKWTELLTEAVTKPGMISKAYHSFHGYSIGNQMMALLQCQIRGIEPGPISTYPGWKAKGRQVKRGEKAIVLCMPVTSKRKAEDEGEEDAVFVRFLYKANWFVLCQTEGEPIEILTTPDWDRSRALSILSIR